MAVSCISDIHVGTPGGERHELLMKFLSHPKTLESGTIAFLGDVFDHLTGEHRGYLEKYREFFDKVARLLEQGKDIYFVEGNHDFHFENTLAGFLEGRVFGENRGAFTYARSGFALQTGDKNVYFCHGDELDLDNKAYRRWKKIYSSRIFGFFISNILSYSVVEAVGRRASENSRQRGRETFDFDRQKERYRKAAERFLDASPADLLVSGHTHIADDHYFEGGSYHNVGFPPKDNAFLLVDEQGVHRIPLV